MCLQHGPQFWSMRHHRCMLCANERQKELYRTRRERMFEYYSNHGSGCHAREHARLQWLDRILAQLVASGALEAQYDLDMPVVQSGAQPWRARYKPVPVGKKAVGV